MKADLETTKRGLVCANKDLEVTKSYLDSVKGDLESTKSDLETAIQHREVASQERAALTARIQELEARAAANQQREEELASDITRLESDAQRSAAQNAEVAAENVRLRGNAKQLAADHARWRAEALTSATELARIRVRPVEERMAFDEGKREVERQLEDENKRLEDELLDNKARLASEKQRLEARAVRRLAEVESALEEAQKQVQRLEEAKRLLEEGTGELEVQKQQLIDDNGRLEDEKRQVLDAKERLEGEKQQLGRRLEDAETALMQAGKRVEHLLEETRQLEAVNKQLKVESEQDPCIKSDRRLVAANRTCEDLRADNLHVVRQLVETESALAAVRKEVIRIGKEKERWELGAKRLEGAEEGEILKQNGHPSPFRVDSTSVLPPSSSPLQSSSTVSSSPPRRARSPVFRRTLFPFMLGAAPASPPRSSSPAVHSRKPFAHSSLPLSLPPRPVASTPSPRKRSRAAYEAGSENAQTAPPANKARVSPAVKVRVSPAKFAPKKRRIANAGPRVPLGVVNGTGIGGTSSSSNSAAPRKLGISHIGLLYETVGDRMRCRMCLPGAHGGIAEAGAPWGELVGHALFAHSAECAALLKLSPAALVERRQRLGLGRL